MKILSCNLCDGELDIINNDKSILKKVKCLKCGFTNSNSEPIKKEPEIFVIRKKI